MLRHLLAGLALGVLAASGAAAYEPKPIEALLDQNVSYAASIPKPEDVTGYQAGEIVFPPHMHEAYIRAVDAASDRVSVSEIGRSHFGRPIYRVTITSPRNQARLDEIRAVQQSLSGANAPEPPADHPAVVQITHGVHGSEPSAYDSAKLILYHLAAAQGAEAERLLDEVVVHLVIMVNPDGANRFAQWTNMHHAAAPVADPQHREHFYEWPWGRTNHYWFDLNRQWLPVTQPEARAVVAATHDWLPNIAADLHEMGKDSTFFFSPGPVDGLHPLLSQDALELNLDMNSFLAEQLDGEGALYVSEEVFDDFYLGYGSSYPGLVGSIPYLFEQSSVRGIVQETEFGTLRYDDKVGQQARVALALIRAGQARRSELQAHLAAFFAESRRLASSDPVNAYVFTSTDRGRLADFLEMLAVHEIEVRELRQPLRADGRVYEPGEAFVVPVAQDQYRIVKGLFETRVIEDKAEFYDVSGWTQPLAWDLDYSEVRGRLFSPNVAGAPVEAMDRAAPAPERSRYAYVMEWDSWYAPRALYRVLDAGLRARVIPDETVVRTPSGEVEPGRGAIVVPIAGQDLSAEEIHALMVRAAEEDSVTVHAATTALTSRGSDLGGFALGNVEKPEILLVTGREVSMNDAGELWHLLDHEMHMPVSMIDVTELSRADLARYTHILMADGRYGALDEDFRERLNTWISGGGVLIASRGAARWAAEHDISSAAFLGENDEASEEDSGSDSAEAPDRYEDIDAWDAEVFISGALFETRIDPTHPLGFGYSDEMLPVHKIGTGAFAPSDNPFALPVRFADNDPLLSGYASEENREMLEGAGMVHAERKGAGSVILFSDNPVFRAYMKGSARLVTNAIFFGDDFRNPGRRTD
ncbi:MAG: M14 family zinc carboxypeptidase [Oceanicaulis sp.]